MIRLDTVDSTNNYAMRRIEAATAEHGDLVLAERQTVGKGQRGKFWYDRPGESLLMSLIIAPGVTLEDQPAFLAAISVAVCDVIARHTPAGKTAIKWPNDILVGDKKAVGILIENVVRGMNWQWSVVGIGVNVGQISFPDELPRATSLKIENERVPEIETLAQELAAAVLCACALMPGQSAEKLLEAYNERLYQRGRLQAFHSGHDVIVRRVLDVDYAGKLRVLNLDGNVEHLTHGSVEWIWRD
jgi:BirA family biotin operon repressor/biotin-[acetyl-CoA-carboxylase] ligase